MRILRATAAGACTLLIGLTVPALAQSSGGSAFTVGGGPTRALDIAPGQSTSTSFDVLNGASTTTQFQVDLTGLRFEGQTAQFNGRPSPGLATSVDAPRFSLAPGASRSVRVDLRAAADAKPGGLYAGVVFKVVPDPSAGDAAKIVAAQARPLVVHVPGPVDDDGRLVRLLPAPGTKPGGDVTFLLTFLDTGTIDYQVGVTMDLRRPDGRTESAVSAPSLVLPGNERAIPVTFTGPHPEGTYEITARATYGQQGQRNGTLEATAELSAGGEVTVDGQGPAGTDLQFVEKEDDADLWEIGIKFASLLLLLVALLLLALAWWKRRRRDEDDEPVVVTRRSN
jgi:hypothetical protein